MDILGIDAGATWVKAARFSPELIKKTEVSLRSGAAQGIEAYFDSVAEAVRRCTREDADVAVGLALPGTFTKDRRMIRYAANIQGFGIDSGGVVIADSLMRRLGPVPWVAENDAKCAAFAEWALGWGKGDVATYLLHVTWGTGIGTGFVADGSIAYGWEGGHMPIMWSNETHMGCSAHCRCACDSYIDLESHAAVPRLIDRAQALLHEGALATELTTEHFIDRTQTSKALTQLAHEGDQLAQALLRDALLILARGLHAMAIVAYPDVVTIGGAMMSNDWLLEELRRKVGEIAQGFTRDTLRPEMVQRAKLGNEAGVLGAAVLARKLLSCPKKTSLD